MATVKEFISSFDRPEGFEQIRTEAINLLEGQEFPDRKTEAWKYTRIVKLAKEQFKLNTQANFDLSDYSIPDLDCYELVFLNGKFAPDLSSYPNDCNISLSFLGEENVGLVDAMNTNGNPFTMINQAYFTDGLLLKVKKNIQLCKPIHVIHVAKGDHATNQVRHRIEVEEGAEVQVLFSYLSNDNNMQFNNVVLEAQVAENAGLNIIKLQDENTNTFHIAKDRIHQSANSRFSINTVSVGGQLVRNDLEIMVAGTNCETVLNGAYVTGDTQHVDNHTVVDHLEADCYSNELYKGVLGGKSTGVFNGKVFVRQDSQRINAFQSNANILLSDDATINTKPELEIYADDVKCSHGSTTGQLNKEAVFYLRARGMSEQSAKKMLVAAFVKESIMNLKDESIQNWLAGKLDAKFATI